RRIDESEKLAGILWARMARKTRAPSLGRALAAPRASPSRRVWSERPTKAAAPMVCTSQPVAPAACRWPAWSGLAGSAAMGSPHLGRRQRGGDERLLHLAHHRVVEAARRVAGEAREEDFDAVADLVFERAARGDTPVHQREAAADEQRASFGGRLGFHHGEPVVDAGADERGCRIGEKEGAHVTRGPSYYTSERAVGMET